jgi:hypothetical protein
MTQPRYQIFVSSTFKDLQEERQAVLNAVLKLNQFPAGMEIFPAVNDTAWEHIEKVIELSDYYVLIIGGKYGSIEAESGISYTEKEYDFAVSKNIPVLAFTHSDEQSIPVGKSEMNEEIRKKLKLFKQKVGNKHHWNYWETPDELKANVATSLAMSFATNPQKGWVKAGGVEKVELLERLAELQQKYENLVGENNKLKEDSIRFNSQRFAFGNDIFELKYEFFEHEQKIDITWNSLFIQLGKQLLSNTFETEIRNTLLIFIQKSLNTNPNETDDRGFITSQLFLYDSTFDAIRNQFLALGLIEISEKSSSGTAHTAWKLTEKGRKIYLIEVAIPRNEEQF